MFTYDHQLKAPYLWRCNQTNPVTGKAPIYLRIEIEGYERAEHLLPQYFSSSSFSFSSTSSLL
ncbi:MAG TPA: hypothetical protein VF598_00315 [Hymenobacter sp.]|jgi:hypothetical protein